MSQRAPTPNCVAVTACQCSRTPDIGSGGGRNVHRGRSRATAERVGDFQFDSTIDGKAITIASMIDEHTRESLVNIVERSIRPSLA